MQDMETYVITCLGKGGQRQIAIGRTFTSMADAVFYALDDLEPGLSPIILPIRDARSAAKSICRRMVDRYPDRTLADIHQQHLNGVSIACLGNDYGVAFRSDENARFDECLRALAEGRESGPSADYAD